MDLKQIETALAAEVIYNVDFVELKTRLNRLIEKAHRAASDVYLAAYINGGRTGTGDVLQDVYYNCPGAHSFKAYARRLPHAAPPAYQPALDAYRAVLTTYKPAADLLAAAKGRVIKARKPSANPRKTPERTIENTGTCACCGQNVKLFGNSLFTHGYTIRWGFQSGACFGTGYPPIEVSPKGIEATIAIAERRLGEFLQSLEYSCLTQRGRRECQQAVVEVRAALVRYKKRLASWAPRALPDGRADHL